MRPVIGLAVLLGAGSGGIVPARAQMDSREAIALQDEILELRNEVQALQSQRGAPPPVSYGRAPVPAGGSDLAPQLLDRVARLEDEVRSLHGQLDEAINGQRRMADDLGKQIADLQFRLQNGNGAPGDSAASPSAVGRPPRPPNTDAMPAPPPRTPQVALQRGEAALARRDYDAAASAAREVLASGRTGPSAGAAQMLLGQTLSGKRDFQGAAVAYGDADQRLRGSSRGQDALLGLASSLSAINERPAACGALDELRNSYPSARSDVQSAAAAVRSRAGCR